jgi:hypothetical protein
MSNAESRTRLRAGAAVAVVKEPTAAGSGTCSVKGITFANRSDQAFTG